MAYETPMTIDDRFEQAVDSCLISAHGDTKQNREALSQAKVKKEITTEDFVKRAKATSPGTVIYNAEKAKQEKKKQIDTVDDFVRAKKGR